jgi:hypothetical protein
MIQVDLCVGRSQFPKVGLSHLAASQYHNGELRQRLTDAAFTSPRREHDRPMQDAGAACFSAGLSNRRTHADQ